MGRTVHRADSHASGNFMILTPAPLEGACIVDPERKEGVRGFFARTRFARAWVVLDFRDRN
jgi:hypothetical protein